VLSVLESRGLVLALVPFILVSDCWRESVVMLDVVYGGSCWYVNQTVLAAADLFAYVLSL
ncbi:hypothetical protein L195_g041860, partial [Trifolium pratense]